jgi:hypothetical protein
MLKNNKKRVWVGLRYFENEEEEKEKEENKGKDSNI